MSCQGKRKTKKKPRYSIKHFFLASFYQMNDAIFKMITVIKK